MSSASNSLAREFLTDVNRLCNAVVQRAEAREEEEEETHMAALGQYLVQGRGFTLLTTLNSIIDQELTCREELLTLLLSLLPLVWKIPVQEEKVIDFHLPFTVGIHLTKDTHSISLCSTQEELSFQSPVKFSSLSRKTRRQRKTTQRYSVRDARKSQLSTSDSEGNSDDRSTIMIKHRRSQILQPFLTYPPRDNYLASTGDPSLGEPVQNSRPSIPVQELKSEILSDSASAAVVTSMGNSPFDLCQVLLSLLEKVCKFDITLNHNSALAATVVPTLTEYLSGFADCCNISNGAESEVVSAGWTEEPVALVQRMLFRTVLHLLSIDIASVETMPDNLRKNLTDLLKAALKISTCLEKQSDCFTPTQKKTLKEVHGNFVFSNYCHRALLLPELLEGVLQILICCLQSAASNPFYFSQAMDLIHEFIQHHGFKLFEITVLQMEWLVAKGEEITTEASEHLTVLINSITKIISTIKKVKSEQLHQSMCTRKRHRRCEYSHFMHHHRDLSGLPVSAFKSQVSQNPFEEVVDGEVHYPERCCCIAVCAHQCFHLLQQVSLSSTCAQILSGIHNVGICCCMDPKSVITPLLLASKLPALKNFQQHILSILNKFILDQLGGAEVSQKIMQAACNICTIDCNQLAELEDTLQNSSTDTGLVPHFSNPSYRFQGILPSSGSEDLLLRWDALEAYQDFAFEEDKLRSVQIASHICHLIQKGNVVVQWKLYNYIYNPVLQRGVELAHHSQQLGVTAACNHVCSCHSRCLPQEVLQIYLQTLPALFKSRIIQNLFLSFNGVNQMTELNYLDSIRSHSLKVFETLIFCLEAQQKDQTMPELEGIDNDQKESILDVVTSFHSQQISDVPQSLSKFYAGLREAYPKKKKCVNQDIHVNLINLFLCVAFLCVSKEEECDRDSANDSEDTSGYDSTASEPLSHKLPCLSLESLTLPSLEHIHRAADIWSMCRWIYLCSSVFQRQFHRLGGFEVCHRLIIMIIQKLAKNEEKVKEKKERTFSENDKGLSGSLPNELLREDSYHLTVNKEFTQPELNSLDENPYATGQLVSECVSCDSSLRVEQISVATVVELDELKKPVRQENEWSLQSIRLLEALLTIFLHSANNTQQKVEVELLHQSVSLEDILLEMRDQLARSRAIETYLAKPLLDSLLRVALGNYSADLDHSEEKTEKIHHTEKESVSQPEDLSEEAEESQSCTFKLFAEEEGYEADSESEDSESKDEGTESKREAGCIVPSSYSSDLIENINQGELIYPEICMLELNLLSAGNPSLDVLAHVFQSFLKVIRQKEKNASFLMQQGAVKNLLGGFLNILVQKDSSFHACQIVLVELLVSLMSSRTCAEELTLLLRIFLEETPCTEILLKGILKTVETNMYMSPLQYLSFPMLQSSNLNSSSSQKSTSAFNSKTTGVKRAKVSQNKKEADGENLTHQLLSSWHVAPIHLPLVGQNCWPHMSEGFSVSLWFHMERVQETESPAEKGKMKKKRNKPLIVRESSFDATEESKLGQMEYLNSGDKLIEDGCVHIISLGSKALMIQVWADVNTGAFIFRMCMDPNDEMKAGLLAQAESPENIFLIGRWQHLAVTYLQQPEGKKNIHGELSLWVSGQRKHEISLDYTLPRKTSLSDSSKTFCMVGHCTSSQEELLHLAGKWDLGNLLLFNGAKIGPEEAFYLYACGPDFSSLMPCKYGKTKTSYSKYISKDILQCEKIKELFMTNKEVDIGPLIESLAVVYTTCCPAFYTIYEPVIRMKGQVKTVPSQRPFSSKEVQNNLLDAHHLKTLQPVEYKTLQGILHEIGGTGAFIFLFARVVDISDCEETQALALQLILSLTKYNQQRIQEMENCNGYSMIHQVLIKPKCIVGFYILKTLLEGCCSDEILNINESGQFMLDANSTAVIQDIKLLEELLLDWKIWSKAQQGVWETLLAALEILIRANHHHQMFNIKQLLKAQVLHHFLLTCQVLQEQKEGHLTSLPREVCRSFVKIIEEVLGSPPDLELLTLIFNFLLAVHPPTNTYVCHNPTNFYFALHIDGKIFLEKVQSIKYLRDSSSGGKSLDSSTFVNTSPTGFTASALGGNISKIRVPQLTHSQAPERRCKSLPASPTASPQVHPKRLLRSLGRSIDDLQEVVESDSADPKGKNSFVGSSETLKRVQEELFVSSCESAKTVCDSDLTSAEAFVDISKEELELPANKEVNAELKSNENGAAVESSLRRPDNLKGLPSFQKSQHNFAGLGLAFPAHSGSSSFARWSSLTDRTVLPEDWESLAFSSVSEQTFKRSERPDYRSTEDCLVLICCGLYDLLRGVLLILPDIMLEDVIDRLIQPDTLTVLVNHPSPLIQQGVIKLLDAYFNRATREQKEKFLKNRGFSLLANQLYLHQGTQELVECFLEMLFGRSVRLDEEFDMEDVKNAGLFQKWCVIPVLGLIENSLYNNVLLHNSFCLLLQIINSCSKMTDMLLDNGLLYVLSNTLAALNGLETNIPLNDYKLLVCDIQQLLVAVTIHACSSSGSQYFRVIEDLIVLLGLLQNNKNEKTQNMAIALQFRVLQAAIELIKATANQDSQNLTNSLQLPATHHNAMFQQRKSIPGPKKMSLAQSDTLVMKMRLLASDELSMMMQRRMSQENPIRASDTELIQRLQRLTVLAVNRFIYQEPTEDCLDVLGTPEAIIQHRLSTSQLEVSEEEDQRELPSNTNSFLKEMFKMLVEGIKISIGTSRISTPKQQWRKILLSCKDTFRMQLGRLLVHMLSPARPLQERKLALEIVCETNHKEIMRDCLSSALQHGPKLALYLYELMHDCKNELTEEELLSSGVFMDALKFCGYKCIPPNAPPKPDLLKVMKEDQKKYEAEECMNKAAWEKTMSNNQQNLSQRLDAKSKDISKIAADITQAVSLSQGMERKKVIQHIRRMYKTDLSASRHWQELVQQLTHDRALWYDPLYYPTSWQLDPTEGPNRERRRLQRCYLTIPNKYLLRDRQKQEEVIKPPLSYLFEDKTHSSHSSTVKDKAASENIRVNRRCISVAPSRETAGELLLGKYGMYFVEDNASDTVESSSFHGETEPASFSWTYEEIKEVHKRWWQLRDNAVEIFLTNGRTLLLTFDNTKVRDDVYHNILTNHLPNLLEYGNITALTHLWYTGQITNFEYLTHLNKHAGRSFNDLMQYPVFPFILSDYTSETLDLNDPSVYRNLAKPIAVQSKEKEDRYVDTYKYLEEEYRKGAREDDPMPPVQPYHYGSHYSNSGTVLHFLVRLPPFTKMFLAYQDQSFDIPDRTFHSTHTTWRLSSYESMTDVKELIPEFFYLPEFLVNREGFDFGLRQNGERVNHVNLPPWARNDPRLFILIHRQALESDHVSQTICNWIDLVFGYKQKGKASVQAINVFHPATYFGMDVSAVEDPVQRRALETMIKTYGQTPRQLFHTAHVSRPGSRLIMEGELPAAMGLLVQFAFRETREHAKEIVYPSPLPWIKGLKWGEYVGSPSAPDPVVCFSQPHGERFGSLQALPTRAICGLSRKFCLLMIYSKEQGVRSMHSTDIQWSAILSWGYADNILRLKSKQSEPPINFIQSSQLHQVTSCAWVSDSCQLFTGSKSGVITAYMNRFSSNVPSEMEMESQIHLYGHTAEITSLFVCKPYSIMISVSKDGTCIIWDLNRLCYVQSLAGHKSPVTAVSASEMTGDIVTVCDSVGGGSDLRLWTVNGDLVGHVHCREIICSVAFSNQPEGVSINVIAGGLENGLVRLWSTWDLKPVREITFPKSNKPIVSLTFSCDGHHLYTANNEGTVIAWCRKDQQRLKLPMFYSFLSSYAAG
nr:lysosomal-trafficking regulator isoform X1 [Pelodiscus sinensis]XP_014428565.1 lysosomal-trafficking regulator isoform X1 [Pelodiscus sinensis]XP_025039908.1 lysosomal-trafficking regulator isoform X1 [Pelodiscus sinensis]XP_025039909.1 lysosomal-trafficking regulator isoform X1 [Pelodiscus sinensis]XP_025039910.1 lysosomal-trafficking regulator isoform X1 [Pelodiscus sinensis]XP_025039911.1 lysosomal-trafficking regulator isoform X1 [Pelodiscus sinensis]|eukprot:XP_006122129.1 lysosomal-trafficking regulator isoform X1 [Pelodiscus sinensis]